MRAIRLLTAAAAVAVAVAVPTAASAGTYCTLYRYEQQTPAGPVTLYKCAW
jgi:hypothetical protein